MRRLLRPGLCATLLFLAPTVVHSADITVLGQNERGLSVIRISGRLTLEDVEKFADATRDIETAIVSLDSPGGALVTGLRAP